VLEATRGSGSVVWPVAGFITGRHRCRWRAGRTARVTGRAVGDAESAQLFSHLLRALLATIGALGDDAYGQVIASQTPDQRTQVNWAQECADRSSTWGVLRGAPARSEGSGCHRREPRDDTRACFDRPGSAPPASWSRPRGTIADPAVQQIEEETPRRTLSQAAVARTGQRRDGSPTPPLSSPPRRRLDGQRSAFGVVWSDPSDHG
jgi:hypothetical protein